MSFADWSNQKKKEREQNGAATAPSVSTSTKSTFADWSNDKKASAVDENFINTFITDVNSFLGSAEEDFGKIGWSNASSSYEDRRNKWSDLSSRAISIRRWLDKNKDRLDEDSYKSFTDALDSFDSGAKSVLDTFKNASDYYSQWDSEDAYKAYEKQQAEYEKIRESDDFTDKSQYSSTKTDNWWDRLWSDYSLGYDDLTYEYINNQNGIRDEIKGKYTSFSRDNAFAEGESMYEERGYGFIKDEEAAIYNYFYATEGKERAQEFLDSIETTLVARKAGKEFEGLEGNALKELFYGIVTGADQFRSGLENLGAYITGDEGHTSSTQLVSGLIREDLADNGGKILGSSIGQIGYDLINTTTNMLPSILVGTVTGGLGGALTLGASAVGNAYSEMRRLGYDEWQSRGYATLVGASEAMLQYFLGGFSKLGGKLSGNVIGKFLGGIDNAFARTAIKLGGNMLSEGLEESIQEVLDPVFKSIATGEDFEGVDWEQVAYSGLLGALSAGVLEGAGTISGEVKTHKEGKEIKDAGGVERLKELGSSLSADTVAYKLAGKVNENTGAYTIGRLFQEVGATVSEQNAADIASGLEEKGMSSKVAKKLARQYQSFLNGEMEMTDADVAVLENLDPLADVLRKNIIGRNTTVYQRTRAFSDVINAEDIAAEVAASQSNFAPLSNEEVARRRALAESGDIEAIAREIAEHSGVAQEAEPERKPRKSIDGRTVLVDDEDDEELEIQGIASIEDGKVTLRTNKGEVDTEKILFGTDTEALLYEAVADMSTEAARMMVEAHDPSAGISTSEYIHGFKDAYRYGFLGFAESELAKGTFTKGLSETQKHRAYLVGKNAGEAFVKERQAARDAKKSGKATTNTGKVVINGKEYKLGDKTGLRGIRDASVKGAAALAHSIGANVYFYESYLDKNGKRVYRDENGEVQHAPHGKYDPKTGYIYIDLNAGKLGEGVIMYTVAHEMTHFIRDWSPAKFKVFADFLLENYAKNGVSVEALVQGQIQKAAKNGRDISFDEAYEEVIADSCQAMLTDGNAIKKIAELKAKDATLWQKIKDFLSGIVAKIKRAYAGLDPYSEEGRFVKDKLDVFEQLQSMWVDALVDAGETYSEVRDALGEDSTIKVNEDGEFLMGKTSDGKILLNDRTWDEGGREILRATLALEGYSTEDIDAALTIMDGKHQLVEQLNKEFIEQDKISKATLTTDLKTGKAVLSALVSNGDYPVNIDLLMVCKKRQAYQRVINRLCETGLIKQATLDSLAIAEINKILGKYGFETACLGCFVESRRIRIQEWAETICKEWNGIVDKMVGKGKAASFNFASETFVNDLSDAEIDNLADDLDAAYERDGLHYGRTTVVKKMEQLLREVPSLRKHLSVADLITPQGRTHLKQLSSELNSLVACRYGSNTPKIVQDFNPYNHELAQYGSVPTKYKSLREYLYAIGGARMQSFSDFIVENWFDYCQIVADLAARKLPMHTYTKEIVLAKLFGMTGIKINMSLIPDIDKSMGKEYAGLTRNAKGELELIWGDKDRFKATGGKSYMQSINFADAVALQNDPRYSANIGTIAVGVSDKHIEMMLDDPRIRMIIPYHSSGMNPIFANLVGTEYYTDYTDVQNATVKQLYDSNGKAVSIKLEKSQKDNLTHGFDFNAVLQELGDARAAANAYLEWCADASKHSITIKGETYTAVLTPEFEQFSGHENYYKVIEDFNTYDSITEQAAPQGDVQQIYPDNFEDILRDELTVREKYRQKQEPKWDAAMGEIESYLKKHTKKETIDYAKEHGIKLSKKDMKLSDRDSDRGFPDNAEEIAKEHFGTTKKWSETGWLLRDGTQLDFSGRHWERHPEFEIALGESYYNGKRNVEHLEIAEAFQGLRDFSSIEHRGENLDGFLSRGNIRVVGKGCIDLKTMPTDEQFEKLQSYFRENVDKHIVVGIGLDGLEFRAGTNASTIIEGIRDYFSNNRSRQSDLMRFHTKYSDRVTDQETLDFLENQEHITVYRAMQVIDGKLYPPMNAYTYDENGKKVLMTPSEIGAWEQSVERPDLIDPKTGKFKLDKGKVDSGKRGTPIPAAYNPYIHTSLSMLNDQFTSAYQRSNLVVVKGVVPKSELTSGYRAQYAKDSVGETEWHSGVVSAQLPESRKVILSRWFKPVEIMSDDNVARGIKKMLGDTGVEIPYNVVSPKLRRSLEKIGVPIGEGRGLGNLPAKSEVKYDDRDNSNDYLTEYAVQAALYDSLDHADKGHDNLIRISAMPRYIVDLLGIDGDFYIYRNHAYENMVSADQAKADGRFDSDANYHDLGVELMTEAVMSLDHPIMTLATKSKDGNPTVIMILPVFGKNDTPLFSVMSFYANKEINGRHERKPHIVLTIHERNYFEEGGRVGLSEVIKSAVDEGRVLDFDKKRREDLSVIAKSAGLGNITETSLKDSLTDFRKFVKTFREKNKIFYSDRDSYAPVFFSHMGKVIDDIKIAKMGAGGVVSYLKGKGVKNEEIKWSGIEAFLEGKKSVTKEELQEFVAGSQLQIVEQMSGEDLDLRRDGSKREYTLYDLNGEVLDVFTYNEFLGGYVADSDEEIYANVFEIREAYGKGSAPKWADYKLDGGSNYRELVFQMPNSSYSNRAMRVHWGQDAEGVLAHTRVQDFETADGKMLFIEEIQSDWHNEGHQKGYVDKSKEVTRKSTTVKHEDGVYRLYRGGQELYARVSDAVLKNRFPNGITDDQIHQGLVDKHNADLKKAGAVPDAPFRDSYPEYVMKRLIRMAAEEGYDIIGWTPSEIQVERWSEDYADGYRIEYDQDIPKFLRKYGKRWGATVGKTTLDLGEYTDADFEREFREAWEGRWSDSSNVEFDSYIDDDGRFTVRATNYETGEVATSTKGDRTAGNEVWSMPITDAMKQSVLHEGQPLYSDRSDSDISNRELLANSLESVAQNDIERNKLAQYKAKIAQINAEEQHLSELKAEIGELSFAKGKKDVERIKKLQFEAKQAENRINTYDRQLLSLEASAPLKAVLEREKKMAYKKAEKRGKDALAAYREKSADTQRKLLEKARESRQKGIEGRRKTEMRHKIRKVVSDLDQLLRHGSKERNVKLGLQAAVASALEAVNMDTVAADERIAKLEQELMKAKTPEKIQEISRKIDHIREQGDRMTSKLEALRRAYVDIKNSEQGVPDYYKNEATLIADKVDSVMKKVGDTPLRNMSLSQLEAVHDLYRVVLTTVRNVNSLFVQGKLEDLHKNASDVMSEVETIKPLKEERPALGDWWRRQAWNEMIPVYAFERIGSKTLTKFFWETIKGQNTFATDMEEAKAFSSAAREKYGYAKWDLDKIREFKLEDGRTFRVSLRHMMSIYAYSKREQALDHMRVGGFFFNDKDTFRKEKGILKMIKSNEAGYTVSEDVFQAIKEAMTKEQIQYVDEMQDYLTKMGEKGNEVSRVLWGIDIFKEKVYFPLKSSRDFIYQANQPAQESSLKNDGMTKETIPHASNPIVLEAFDDVWASHIERMSKYHAFVLPIENLNKIHNYGTWVGTESMSVSTMLRARHSDAANEYLTQFIRDLNGASSMDGVSNPVFSLFNKFKKTAVAASMSVVTQQPTAILRALAVMDARYFVGMPTMQKLSTKWDELKKYAPIATIKDIGGFDAGGGRQMTEWLNADTKRGLDKVMGKVDDLTMLGAALGDQIGWCTIWEAVKREIKATTNLKEGSEEFLQKAGERFTEVIVLTQVYDSTLSRSGFMRSKHESVKMMTSFMGEPTVSFNMLMNAVLQAKGKKITKRKAARIVGAVYASVVAASVAASAIYALRDDDDDEAYLEKFAEAFSGKMKDELNPLNMLPIMRDIMSIMDGWDVERTDVAIFKDIKDAFDGLSSENKSAWRKVEDFAGAVASLVGVPLKNLLRTGREVYNLFENIFDTESPTGAGVKNAIDAGITGKEKSNGQQLYEAILNGDQKQIDRVSSRFDGKTEINTALRKALRDNDPRINEAAKAIIDEDFSKYTRIANEIIGEGNFSEANIVAAIKAEVNSMTEEEEKEETVDKDVSIYEMDYFYSAVVGGDTVMAHAIREDIIRTAVANGKEREEAEKNFNSSFQSRCREKYEAGELSDREAVRMLVSYGGKTEAEAQSKVQYWDFKQDNPDTYVSEYWIDAYNEDVASSGVSLSMFIEYKNAIKDIEGDGAKARKMDVINSLPISNAQKDALYFAEGWAASKLYEAPWR